MFGGSPYPQYLPMNYGQSHPTTQSMPAAMAPQAYAQPVPFPTGWQPKAPAQQAAAPKWPAPPTARAKQDDEPPAAPMPQLVALSLPAPEALGITVTAMPAAPAAPAAAKQLVDWNATRARLDQLKADFSVTKLPGGSFRVLLGLPTANPNLQHMIEVISETEALAVTTAMARAEQWAKQ